MEDSSVLLTSLPHCGGVHNGHELLHVLRKGSEKKALVAVLRVSLAQGEGLGLGRDSYGLLLERNDGKCRKMKRK